MWKIKSLVMVFALAIGVVGATAEETNVSLVKNIAQGEIPKGITDLMSSQYGAKNYNKSKHCWKYHYHGKDLLENPEDLTYCIQPKKYVIQTINGKPLTFVLANSDSNTPEGSYQYTEGMMGLFVIDENEKIISKDKAIIMGYHATTVSDDASFQQIGKEQYGWIVNPSLGYGDMYVDNFYVFTSMQSKMKIIAGVGIEDNRDTTHVLDFINDGSEHFPIQIYKIFGEKKVKYKKMIFDKKQNIYIDEK